MRALEHLINLEPSLAGLEALLDDVGGEFELAETDKVARDEVQNLVVAHFTLQLEHVLYQIVSERVFNKIVNSADDHVCQGQLLPLEAFLEAALHDTAPVLV